MLSTKNMSEKVDTEEDYDNINEVNANIRWIKRKLKLCQKFLICMDLANRINNDNYLISSMIYCYHAVVPFLTFDNPPEFVIHILMKCHAVFMKRDSFDKRTVDYIYDHYFASLTHTLIYFLNLWNLKEELFIICKNTLDLIHSFTPRSDRMIPSNSTIDHLWASTLDKFKKSRFQNKKCPGQVDYLYFSASSIYSNSKLIEKTNAMVYLADYVDYYVQINDLGTPSDRKLFSDNYTTMAEVEYGIHIYSLESMYNEINKFRKSKRYMEMIYKLLSVAYNRKEYEFIYKVYYDVLEWTNKRNFFILHTDDICSDDYKKIFKKIKSNQHPIFKPRPDDKVKKKKKKNSARSRSRSRDSRSSSTDGRSSACEDKNDTKETDLQKSDSHNSSNNEKGSKSKSKSKSKSSKKKTSKDKSHQRSLSFDDRWNKYIGEKRSQSFHKKEINRMRSHSQDMQVEDSRSSAEKSSSGEKYDFEREIAERERQNRAANLLANIIGFFWRRRRYRNKLCEIFNNENFYLCMIHYIASMAISKLVEKEIVINEMKAPTLAVSGFYVDIGNYFNTGRLYQVFDRDIIDEDGKENKFKTGIDVEKYCTELLESYIRSMVTASRSQNWNLLLLCFHQLWNFIGDMQKLELINTKYWRLEICKPFYIVSIELLDFLIIHCSDDEHYNRYIDILDLIRNDSKRLYHYHYVNRWGFKSDIAINIKLIIKFFIDSMEYLYHSEKYSTAISLGLRVNHYFYNTLTEILLNIMNESKNQYNLRHPHNPITLPEIYDHAQIPNDLKTLGARVIQCKGDFIRYINGKYTINSPDSANLTPLLRRTILSYEELIKVSRIKDDLLITAIAYSELGDLLYESGDVESAGLFWSKSIDTIFKKRMVIASINELYNELKDLNTSTFIKLFNNSIYMVILIGFQIAKLAVYSFSSNLNTKLNLSLVAALFFSKAMYTFINEPHVPSQFLFVSSKTVRIINVISEFFNDQSSNLLTLLNYVIIELVNNDYLGLALPLLAFQLIVTVNNNKSLREVIFVKLKYAKVLVKCGFISEGLYYLNNVYSGRGIYDINPLTSISTTSGTSFNGNNNIGTNNTTSSSSSNNNNNNNSFVINVNYNNMEGIYEPNNLSCIKQLLYNKNFDRLVSQYGRMMAKVIDFERITLVIEIFHLYHGDFVYYDPLKGISDNLFNKDCQKTFDIKNMKDHIYEDILGVNIKKEKNKAYSTQKLKKEQSLSELSKKNGNISFSLSDKILEDEKDLENNNNNNNNNSNENNTDSNENNSNSNENNTNNDENTVDVNNNENTINVNNSEDNTNSNNDANTIKVNKSEDNINANNNEKTISANNSENNINDNNNEKIEVESNYVDENKSKSSIQIDGLENNNSQSRFSSSMTLEYNIPVENNGDRINKYYYEKTERTNILKNAEEFIYRYITEVYNETKMDDKPYRPFQINFFCFCILKLVKIYELLDKNRRAISLLLSLYDFINKRVNAISEYLDSIVIDSNTTTQTTIDNLIDKRVYEEKLITEFLSESELWLEIKKQTALNALAMCDYNYAIMTSKSGLKDAAACKSSNFRLEFLKIIICSKIQLHSKGVKKYVGKFEEVLRSPNLTLKSKFSGNIFYFDVTSKLNIYTSEEILSKREICENYFYDLTIQQSLTIEDVQRMTKYSPFYTDYVIYLYQQAALYKSIHKYDLSLKCLQCAINTLKYFVNISPFIYLPILNKYYQLLIMKDYEFSSLKTIDFICRTVIDICIQEGGYNVRALKYGFSGLFICSVKLNEIFDAINYLYALSNIGIIVNNIRLLNVNTDMKARLMDQKIQSKAIQNEMKLWYAKENQLYDIYDNLYEPLDITQIKTKCDVKDHVRMKFPSTFDDNKILENIYLYYKYLFFDTNILDNITFDYYSCSKMSRLQRTHQVFLHELPDDILSEITISRLVNLSRTTDNKYMTRFENMWMAQWFHRWNLPCDYEYENKDDDASSLNEKKINDEFYNKKNVLVIYHQNISQNKNVKDLLSKIKKLRKEVKLERKNKSGQSSKVIRSSSKTSRAISTGDKSLVEVVSLGETSSANTSRTSTANNNQNNSIYTISNSTFSTHHKINSISDASMFSTIGTINNLNNDLLSIYPFKFPTNNNNNNNNNNDNDNNRNKMTSYYANAESNTDTQSTFKPVIIDGILSKPEDISNIQKEIGENKDHHYQYKIRNKYYKMEESDFQFMNDEMSGIVDEMANDNGSINQSPKEALLKELYKSLYDKCIYTVKIPKTIVKEIQFICARNEADSKNFFFNKESDSTILDHKLKKDLIKDIVKYLVGSDIKYVS